MHVELIDFMSIEGYPVIIRFKTKLIELGLITGTDSIEGYPVIIRFKTTMDPTEQYVIYCIEGYPVIIRFKTHYPYQISS